jgi:hypothetical protein
MLRKKKSRSIDSRKTQIPSHHNQSGLLKPHQFQHSLSKKSIDLSSEQREGGLLGL